MFKEYSNSYNEAEARYKKYRKLDPFPDIQPALLNSADIADYIRETGMIYPFHQKDLCGATYKVRLKGVCVYYKQDGKHIYRVGEDDSDLPNVSKTNKYEYRDKVVLEPNSITFVTLEPVFQIPDYLVIRFNLRISHVYKGLLLGTGPLIDPGFQGRLSIPLHNLTSNEYVFNADDSVIVLEFTKMSSNDIWRSNPPQCNAKIGKYVPTTIPTDRQVIQYIDKALKNNPDDVIISSVIATTNEAIETAKNAKKSVNSIKKFAIIGVLTATIAIATLTTNLLIPTYQLIKSVTDTQRDYDKRIEKLEKELTDKQNELKHRQQPSTEEVKQNELKHMQQPSIDKVKKINELATTEP